MLNLVKKIIAVLWAILCFNILGLFVGELKNFASYSVEDWIGFTIVAVILAPIVVNLLLFLRRNRCPHCKKFFTMKKESTSKVGEENISILTEVNSYNLNHRKIGTNEHSRKKNYL